MSKMLLDTNTLLDYVIPDRPESDEALELVKLIINHVHTGLVAASSLNDFYYISRKTLSEQERRDWLRIFIRIFDIEELDVEACAIALDSNEPDYEDGCIRAIAERAQVDFIITRDRTAFERSWVKAYSAKRFLELFPPAESDEG